MPKIAYLLKTIVLVIFFTIASSQLFSQVPTITSFSPDSGSIGTLVTITGTNLNNIDTIKIGGSAAIKISASTSSLVAMVMPGATTGAVYLRNGSGNVTSGTNFSIVASIPPVAQQGSKIIGTGNIGTARQGSSVSISADGNTAIISGCSDSSYRGAVWFYIRSGAVWVQQGSKLVGTGNIGMGQQGSSVSISADGNTAIVGAFQDNYNQGAAWIYTRNGGVWSQQGNKLVGTGVIGQANQGSSVSISADGNTAIVGGDGDDGQEGAAWVYIRSGGVWSQQGSKLVGTGSVGGAFQGSSVSISADGNTAIVGGIKDNNNQGAAWVYIRSGGVWSQQGSKLVGTGSVVGPYVYQGRSVRLSADGNTAIVGGNADNNNQGAAWVYIRSGGVWSQQGSKLVGTGNAGPALQGCSVSMSADGNIATVGGIYNSNPLRLGAVWVYSRSGIVWSQLGNRLVGTESIGANIHQGQSVCLSADGNTLAVGGPGDNFNQGAAWIYNGPVSTNANLNGITLSSGSLAPVFMSNIILYTASTVASSVTVIPTKVETNATIQIRVNGGTYDIVTSGSPSTSLSLNMGSNTVDIKVTAQDGITIKIYSITINRLLSVNAKLSSINLIGIPYSPIFHSDTLMYSTSVLFGINNAKVSSILSDTFARIKIKMNGGIYTDINNKDTSGYLPLNVGLNTIYIKVIAQDTNITRTYLINIVRAGAIAPSNLKYNDSVIVATRSITNISASVTYIGDSITSFSITPSLPIGVSLNTTTGLISGISTVTLPQTIFTVTGTNTGGSTTASFTLTVNRIAPSNLKYTDSVIVATRSITNISASVTYIGDSITSFSITPSLPIGISLNTTTGLISGISTVTLLPTVFTVTGTNTGGITTASFTLTVNRIAPSNLKYTDSVIVATRNATNINASVTYTGDSITSFSITPSLPIGVSLNTTTGLISGISTVTLPPTVFTVTGTNTGGSTTASFTLTVNRIAPSNLKY
ncbi:MAG: cadherin-like beta sandwich domain-containing protein, partial [Bacteroidota bacterium]